MKILMRIMFCLMPALVIALPLSLIAQPLGLTAFAGMIMVGINATTARPERGENEE